MNKETAARIISRMSFSATDYVTDKDRIVNEAVQLYGRQTGDMSPSSKTEIEVLLERSFSERKELSICAVNLPDIMRDGSLFSIYIDDKEVSGKLYLSPKSATVEILSPFRGRMAGCEIELLAPAIWTERPEAGSQANEEGKRKSISLLADIYYAVLQEKLYLRKTKL